MDTLGLLSHGFEVALSPTGLMFTFIGVLLGQLVGALPGIGPAAGMALLLPVTFGMEPTFAVMMLAGIMYGGQYGGTLTSVLINVPGEASSLMTAVDGYQLAKQGHAGKALGIAAIASFSAGVGAVIVLVFAAPVLSTFALKFSSPEYFLLAALGLTASAGFGSTSLIKALMVTAVGLLIALIGTDPMAGTPRMTFGNRDMLDGLDFLPVAIGLFGIAEVLASLKTPVDSKIASMRMRDLWPTWPDWVACRMAILRGGVIGFFIGVMPGAGAAIASLMAYFTEQRFSKHPEKFGHGALDGIAAAEAANNASAHGAYVPMLALGIPGGPGTAVLLGALILAGIQPGPAMMIEQPTLVWGLIASMFTGNVILLVLNLPLAPVFASILRIPYVYIAPAILVLSLVGAFAQTLSLFSVGIAIFFGILGYFMIRTDFPRAPLVLSMVLAPIMESALRQSLMFSEGSLMLVALQTIVSREVNALDPAVVTVGMIHGGVVTNQIPDSIKLSGTIRTYKPEVREQIAAAVRRITDGLAAAYRLTAEVEVAPGGVVCINAAAEADIAAEAAISLGATLRRDVPPTMSGDDMGHLLARRPGAYVWIGNGPGGPDRELHNPRYNFNDAILPVAVPYLAALAKRALQD